MAAMLTPFIVKDQCPVPGCKFGSFNASHLKDKGGGPHQTWRLAHPRALPFLQTSMGRALGEKAQMLHRKVASAQMLCEKEAVAQKLRRDQQQAGLQASSEMKTELQRLEQEVLVQLAAKKAEAAAQQSALKRQEEEVRTAREEAERDLAQTAENIQRSVSSLLPKGTEVADETNVAYSSSPDVAIELVRTMLTHKLLHYEEDGTAILSKHVRGQRAVHKYGPGAFPSLADLRRNGLTFAEAQLGGINLAQAYKAGFTLSEVGSGVSLEQCRRVGFTPVDARSIKFHPWTRCPECVRVGFSWNELTSAGFSPHQVEEAVQGLKVPDLRLALKSHGVSEDGLKAVLVARLLRVMGQPATEAPIVTGSDARASGLALPGQIRLPEASASTLDDLELKQDLHAVELSQKLEEEKLARSTAEQARQAAADREVAAAALRATDTFLGEQQALDATAFMARFMAFRQYVEILLKFIPTKTAKTKPWRMVIQRSTLCASVLEYFQDSTKMRLFQSTEVSFVDASTREEEEGHDLGGLTAEMYSCFFREMLLPDAALFEGVDGAVSIGLLPTSSARPEHMVAIGRIMCKCLLDDQPIGAGLGRFIFEYIADTHETRVFQNPHAALGALADFDPTLAQQWAKLLSKPIEELELTLDMFDEDAICRDGEYLPATEEAIGGAIIAGCRSRLLTKRERSLQALRAGFTEHGDTDLRIHLGIFSSDELVRMLRGNTELSAADLSGCFEWPDQAASAAEAAGFETVGSEVPRFLREIIEDEQPETALSSEVRLHILEWATALTALPCGGLKDPILLRLYDQAGDNDLPNVHTCTHEVHLPAYSSRMQLKEKLLRAVEHRHDGFHIE